MLTITLPTNPDEIEESLSEYDALKVGEIIDGEDDLQLEVLAYYQYSPIVLGDSFRVALAIVHPVGQPIPPRSEWYCQQSILSPFASWHLFMHNNEVLRLAESPNGSAPQLGSPFFHYCTDTVMDEPPKLDRASLLKFAATVQQRVTGLETHNYKKYIHPDAPFREIYVIELAQSSKVLQAA